MTTAIHLDAGAHHYTLADIEHHVQTNGKWPADGLTLTTRSSRTTYVQKKKDGKFSPRVPIHCNKEEGKVLFCLQKAGPSPGNAAGEAQIVAFDVPLERSNLCLLLQQCVLTSSVSLHSSS